MRGKWLGGLAGLAAAGVLACGDRTPTEVRPAGPNLKTILDGGGMEDVGNTGYNIVFYTFFAGFLRWGPTDWEHTGYGGSVRDPRCADEGLCALGDQGAPSNLPYQLPPNPALTNDAGYPYYGRPAYITTANFYRHFDESGAPLPGSKVTVRGSGIQSDGGRAIEFGSTRPDKHYALSADKRWTMHFDYAYMTGAANAGGVAVVELGYYAGYDPVTQRSVYTWAPVLRLATSELTSADLLPQGCGTQSHGQTGGLRAVTQWTESVKRQLTPTFFGELYGTVDTLEILPTDYAICTGWKRFAFPVPHHFAGRTVTVRIHAEDTGPDHDQATTFAYTAPVFAGDDLNAPPTVVFGTLPSGSEGGALALGATSSDPNAGDLLTHEWTVPDYCAVSPAASAAPAAPGAIAATLTCRDNGPAPSFAVPVRLTVRDQSGAASSATANVVVRNAAPRLGQITVPQLIRAGASFEAAVPFSDRGLLDTHSASWSFKSTLVNARVAGTADGAAGRASVTYAFPRAGFYDVSADVRDDDGAQRTALWPNVVVYDPSGGALDAVGSVDSPAGAYSLDLTAAGVATFKLVLEYLTGSAVAPSGVMELTLPGGGVFRAEALHYLVVEGANVVAVGCGPLNGAAGYCLWVRATDAGETGDRMHIKIFGDPAAGDEVVYDNRRGVADAQDPEAVMAGGHVRILLH